MAVAKVVADAVAVAGLAGEIPGDVRTVHPIVPEPGAMRIWVRCSATVRLADPPSRVLPPVSASVLRGRRWWCAWCCWPFFQYPTLSLSLA
jgi:hypothetical protein